MANNDSWDSRRKLEQEILQLEAVDGNVEKPSLPSVTLTEKTYTAPTDAELKTAAEDSLKTYKTDGIANVNAASKNDEAALKSKRETVSASMKNALSVLEDNYNSALQKIDSDVLKRGLARSSVAVTGKADLEREYLSRADELRSGYQSQLNELDGEISAVGAKLKKALDDFNLTYAAKLNEKLASLKTEREKKQDEVLKYNNEIRAKQAELDAKRAETESKLYSAALDQKNKESQLDTLTPDQKEQLNKAIFDKMDAYLSSMDAAAARLEIRNHSLYQQHLSPLYYYRLFDKYGR